MRFVCLIALAICLAMPESAIAAEGSGRATNDGSTDLRPISIAALRMRRRGKKKPKAPKRQPPPPAAKQSR